MTKHNSDYWKALETKESQIDRACNNPKIRFVEVPLCNLITAEKGPATWKYDCWLWRQPPVIAYKCTVGQPTQLLKVHNYQQDESAVFAKAPLAFHSTARSYFLVAFAVFLLQTTRLATVSNFTTNIRKENDAIRSLRKEKRAGIT